MQARFHDVGRRMDSNESFIGSKDGNIVRCRDFKEVSDDIAFDIELLKQIKGTPFDPTNTMPSQSPGDDANMPIPQP